MNHDQPTNDKHESKPAADTDPPGFWQHTPADKSWGIGFWCKTEEQAAPRPPATAEGMNPEV